MDRYAAPSENNPLGMCDDPQAFRQHFCRTIMAAGRVVDPIFKSSPRKPAPRDEGRDDRPRRIDRTGAPYRKRKE